MIDFFKRLRNEIKYLREVEWSLEEMGKFWDELDEYDDINSNIYPYKKRFTNSREMLVKCNLKNFNPENCLDLQTRTGKGSVYWSKFFPNTKFYISDFSKNFLIKSKENLKKNKIYHQDFFIKNFPLPFGNDYFEFVLCYETIEHIADYKTFFSEIVRVTKPNGKIILTCPNRSWEIVHFIAAILNINHSEGPHTFIKKNTLDDLIGENNLKLLDYNTTIFFPFNNKLSIFFDEIITKILPAWLKKIIFLRHSYILEKINKND